MATLRTEALNLLRLAGFRSIRSGMQAVKHDITALLAMARRRPQPNPCLDFESALGSVPDAQNQRRATEQKRRSLSEGPDSQVKTTESQYIRQGNRKNADYNQNPA